MPITQNNVDDLRNAIVGSADIRVLNSDIRREIIDVGRFLKSKIEDNSPDGSKWEDPPDVFKMREIFMAEASPRPSLRQHGKTFIEGILDPEIEDSYTSAQRAKYVLVIPSDAPHAEVVVEGRRTANPAMARRVYLLLFWSFANSRPVFVDMTNTKTTGGNDFVDRTYQENERRVQDRFNKFAKKHFFRPIKILFGEGIT